MVNYIQFTSLLEGFHQGNPCLVILLNTSFIHGMTTKSHERVQVREEGNILNDHIFRQPERPHVPRLQPA